MYLLAQAADAIPPSEFWWDKGFAVVIVFVLLGAVRVMWKSHREEMKVERERAAEELNAERTLHDTQQKREQDRCDLRHTEMCSVVTETVSTFDESLKDERKLRESTHDAIRELATAVANNNGG